MKKLSKQFVKDASKTFGIPYETPKDGLVILQNGKMYAYSQSTRIFYQLGGDEEIRVLK